VVNFIKKIFVIFKLLFTGWERERETHVKERGESVGMWKREREWCEREREIREWKRVCVWVRESESGVKERDRVLRVRVCIWERECVCGVKEREIKEWEKERVCVYLRERERESERVCVWVCVSELESKTPVLTQNVFLSSGHIIRVQRAVR